MKVRLSNNDGEFDVSGASATAANAEVLSAYIHAQQQRFLASCAVSVCFIISACFLLVFAPADRINILIPIALGLLAIGLGLGGFSMFKLKTVSTDISASR